MEGLLEALPRLARDAAIGVVVPAWWGHEQLKDLTTPERSCRLGGGASSSRTLRRRSDRAGLVGARVAQGTYDVARRASCSPLS